jgi:hypothetical protein
VSGTGNPRGRLRIDPHLHTIRRPAKAAAIRESAG